MRKKHSFWVILSSLILVMTTLFIMPGIAYASDTVSGISDDLEFNLPYAEPTCDDNSGYFSMIYQDANADKYICWTYFWTITDKVEYTTDVAMAIKFNNNILSFTPQVFGDHFASVTLANYTYDNFLSVCYTNKLYDSSVGSCYNDNYSNLPCVGIAYGGNVILETSFQGLRVPVLKFATSSDDIALRDTLQSILTTLSLMEEDTTTLLSYISVIMSQNSTTNNKLTQLYNLLNQIHLEDNARIIELLEQIEYYLADPGDGSGRIIADFGVTVDKNNQIIDENTSNYEESIPVDENGVPLDDVKEHTNVLMDMLDSIMNEDLDEYIDVLNVFMDNSRIAILVVISLTFSLIGFVFFGRR